MYTTEKSTMTRLVRPLIAATLVGAGILASASAAQAKPIHPGPVHPGDPCKACTMFASPALTTNFANAPVSGSISLEIWGTGFTPLSTVIVNLNITAAWRWKWPEPVKSDGSFDLTTHCQVRAGQTAYNEIRAFDQGKQEWANEPFVNVVGGCP